jgi:hypothetical protein
MDADLPIEVVLGQKILRQGVGWRLGWNAIAKDYPGLVGGDDWAIELTEGEFKDFCRFFLQLAATIQEMDQELMQTERIACEQESEHLWLEVEGFPAAYSLRLILQGGRRCEGNWGEAIVPHLLQAVQQMGVI